MKRVGNISQKRSLSLSPSQFTITVNKILRAISNLREWKYWFHCSRICKSYFFQWLTFLESFAKRVMHRVELSLTSFKLRLSIYFYRSVPWFYKSFASSAHFVSKGKRIEGYFGFGIFFVFFCVFNLFNFHRNSMLTIFEFCKRIICVFNFYVKLNQHKACIIWIIFWIFLHLWRKNEAYFFYISFIGYFILLIEVNWYSFFFSAFTRNYWTN